MNNNIIVVHPGALGDVLLSLKAIRIIKCSFPKQRVILVCRCDVGDLLRACGEIDETISIDGPFSTDLYSPREVWSQSTRKMLDSCTRIVCWLNDADGVISRNLHGFGLDPIIVQSPADATLSEQCVEERYLETLLSWKLEPETVWENIRIADGLCKQSHDEETISSGELSGKVIAIHPGSGSLHKCVKPSLLATVAARLSTITKARLCILKGPADDESAKALCSLLPADSYQVIGGHSLISIVHHLSEIDLFIGHDSGLTHLAVACGVSSVVLFGPTDPCQWAPRGMHVSVIQGKQCECGDWSIVRQCQDKPCLDISADLIVQDAHRLLTQSPSGKISSSAECKLTSYS